MASCPISLNGVIKGCKDNIGGVKRILIADYASIIAPPTIINNEVAYLNVPYASLATYELKKETASFSVKQETNDLNDTSSFVASLKLIFNKQDTAKKIEIEKLAKGNLFVLVEDNNNNWWYMGNDNPVWFDEGTAMTGTAYIERSGYEFTLKSLAKHYPYRLSFDPTTPQQHNWDGLTLQANKLFWCKVSPYANCFAIAPDGTTIFPNGSGLISYTSAIAGTYQLYSNVNTNNVAFSDISNTTVFNTTAITTDFTGTLRMGGYPSVITNLTCNYATSLIASWCTIVNLTANNALTVDASVNQSMVTLSLPVATNVNVYANTMLANLTLPSAQTINASYCTALHSMTAPKGKSVNCTGSAFNIAGIESLLVSFVNQGTTNGNITLNGGSNAGYIIWTANAKSALTTLISRGWTATYNS
jgi:hypothetical protein